MLRGHYDLITFSGYSAGQRGRRRKEGGRTVHISEKRQKKTTMSAVASLMHLKQKVLFSRNVAL